MKFQKITALKIGNDRFLPVRRFASSLDGAATARRELTKQGYKREELTTEEIEVQPTKAGILDALNKHCG